MGSRVGLRVLVRGVTYWFRVVPFHPAVRAEPEVRLDFDFENFALFYKAYKCNIMTSISTTLLYYG